ncbi:MAG: DUF2236 domain-containing protein [Pedobacter sp.]|nr:MAG: DUF2236 domain-containing protein [Pedobacter sp.]
MHLMTLDTGIFNNAFLNSKRLLADPLADNFIEEVFTDPIKKSELLKWLGNELGKSELRLLKSLYPDIEFIQKADILPAWADRQLMRRGSALFVRNSEMVMNLLGLLSLPYCYTAANGAMVLYLSELITKQTTKRLFDTAIFVWEVMGPDAYEETGNAYVEILKIRIIHALVRYHTLLSEKWKHTWGMPINQEDMAGTNLSFSLIVTRGMKKLGIKVSPQDEEAFLHVWSVIGHLMGLNEDLIPKNKWEADNLDLAIKDREFRASNHGAELTQSLINHIMSVNTSKATADDIIGLMRYLLGNEIADMLSMKKATLPSYKLMLLKSLNFLKQLKPHGPLNAVYNKSYTAFKALKPTLKK